MHGLEPGPTWAGYRGYRGYRGGCCVQQDHSSSPPPCDIGSMGSRPPAYLLPTSCPNGAVHCQVCSSHACVHLLRADRELWETHRISAREALRYCLCQYHIAPLHAYETCCLAASCWVDLLLVPSVNDG